MATKQRPFKTIADSLAQEKWYQEIPEEGSIWSGVTIETMRTAAIIDIMVSLRRIRSILECDNVRKMATSTQSIDRAIRGYLKDLDYPKPRKKKAV